MAANRVLVIDDEAAVRFGIRDFLESYRYTVDEADSCRDAEESFRTWRPDAVIADYVLPDGSALDLLRRLKEIDAGVPVIILTAHGSIDLAVQAIKEGAEQFLTKPVALPSLLVILRRLIETQRDQRRQLARKSQAARHEIDPFVGTSPVIRRLADEVRQILATESPILIQGETGTGKGVLALWLHQHSVRAEEPLVDLNCAALSRELLESELFGHEKGAFTGAVVTKQGLLEVAHHGTVFLDEIGDMDPQIQPRFLKVLEEKRFRRVGDVKDRQIDIRLIAATHQDLGVLVQERRFRSDLYFRINTIPLVLPPLRQRGEDIPILARQFLQRFALEMGHGEMHLGEDAEQAIQEYPWPGNIRELRNVIERAVLLSRRDTLTRQDLRFDVSPPPVAPVGEMNLTLLELERRHIERVLLQEGGHVERSAKRLGVPRSTLYQKLKQHGLSQSKV